MLTSSTLEIATPAHSDDSTSCYVPASSDAEAAVSPADDKHPRPWDRFRALCVGLLGAAPTLLLIGIGAKPKAPISSISIYVGLLLAAPIISQYEVKSGVARWFLGFILLALISSWKSGVLLASCDNMAVKAVLYAVTALWECSNVVLILGGKDLSERFDIRGPREVILYGSAPCQVKFIAHHIHAGSDCSPDADRRRSIHISLCVIGLAALYYLLVGVQQVQQFFTSFILLEIECLAIMASLAVVALDIPSHGWQLIYNLLASMPLFASSSVRHASTPNVILPYGFVYSSKSTREFWSRWSRPAMQLVRHLFYYPLGGINRWYISIPVMFLLNATTHFDLSYALIGEKREVYWIALFGTLAATAMLEVAGDKWFAIVESDGSVSFPSWYSIARAILAHLSLRLVLYIMVHLCLKTSLGKLLGAGDDA